MKKYFLFDLDGTLADTGEGIMKSAQYALDDFGLLHEPEGNLRRFVGPPLDQAFMEFYGLSREDTWKAVEKYRERYREKGVFESPLYPGVESLLQTLSHQVGKMGGALCVATSKPILFARQILEMRNVANYFSVIVGANMDGSMTDKAQVIGEVLSRLGKPDKAEAVMIGDRRHDVLGAKTAGIQCIGVGYGYAEPNELETAGADWTVPSVGRLKELCLNLL